MRQFLKRTKHWEFFLQLGDVKEIKFEISWFRGFTIGFSFLFIEASIDYSVSDRKDLLKEINEIVQAEMKRSNIPPGADKGDEDEY